MVKKSCGLPVLVLQKAAQSLLAAHFAIVGTHPLFSRWKKQNIFFTVMVSLSMVVLGERRYRSCHSSMEFEATQWQGTEREVRGEDRVPLLRRRGLRHFLVQRPPGSRSADGAGTRVGRGGGATGECSRGLSQGRSA